MEQYGPCNVAKTVKKIECSDTQGLMKMYTHHLVPLTTMCCEFHLSIFLSYQDQGAGGLMNQPVYFWVKGTKFEKLGFLEVYT